MKHAPTTDELSAEMRRLLCDERLAKCSKFTQDNGWRTKTEWQRVLGCTHERVSEFITEMNNRGLVDTAEIFRQGVDGRIYKVAVLYFRSDEDE